MFNKNPADYDPLTNCCELIQCDLVTMLDGLDDDFVNHVCDTIIKRFNDLRKVMEDESC